MFQSNTLDNPELSQRKLSTTKWLDELYWEARTDNKRGTQRPNGNYFNNCTLYAIDLFDVSTAEVSPSSPFAGLKNLSQPIPYVHVNYEQNVIEAFNCDGLEIVTDDKGIEYEVEMPMDSIWGPETLCV